MVIMNRKPQESTKKSALIGLMTAVLFILQSCAYQLSNLHSATPSNIKSIYVDAVYDTGAEPISHELLWDELQRAIAGNGQLRLASADKADAILRAHIFKTQTAKAGERKTPTSTNKRKEPDVFAGQQSPPTPGQLRDINVANDYFTKTSWSSVVQVEIWDLNTRKLLMQRQYPLSGEVPAIRGDQQVEIHHLRHEESFQHSFGNAARGIADRVISDLLHR